MLTSRAPTHTCAPVCRHANAAAAAAGDAVARPVAARLAAGDAVAHPVAAAGDALAHPIAARDAVSPCHPFPGAAAGSVAAAVHGLLRHYGRLRVLRGRHPLRCVRQRRLRAQRP